MPTFVILKTNSMNKLNFEDFIENTWDYVSENVVSDDYWEKNQEFIKDMTYAFYKRFIDSTNKFIEPKQYGVLLESVFIKLQAIESKK